MHISIIDIGTQSIKHYIFSVAGNEKNTLYYQRYSDANLGDDSGITQEAISRNISILDMCMKKNSEYEVTKTIAVGTQILRTADNASLFCSQVKEMFGLTISIISHEDEAFYLYKGLAGIVGDGTFGAVNIGGGSTEIVIGNNHELFYSHKLEIGVKTLRTMFSTPHNDIDWVGMERFLEEQIKDSGFTVDDLFITGVQPFYLSVSHALGFDFNHSDIVNHPLVFDLSTMRSFLEVLRKTPVDYLKKLHTQDPAFADNVAIGQTLYYKVVEAYHVKKIFPSKNDLTDGILIAL